MIRGVVSRHGVPTITLPFAGKDWLATIDTGFNGDLELPEELLLREYVLHVDFTAKTVELTR